MTLMLVKRSQMVNLNPKWSILIENWSISIAKTKSFKKSKDFVDFKLFQIKRLYFQSYMINFEQVD